MNEKIEAVNLVEAGKVIATESSGRNLVAAGPLSIQPQTNPYRVVLINYGSGGYSVHNEIFHNGLDKHSSLDSGNYYRWDQLVEATTKFAERVSWHAGSLGSLYR